MPLAPPPPALHYVSAAAVLTAPSAAPSSSNGCGSTLLMGVEHFLLYDGGAPLDGRRAFARMRRVGRGAAWRGRRARGARLAADAHVGHAVLTHGRHSAGSLCSPVAPTPLPTTSPRSSCLAGRRPRSLAASLPSRDASPPDADVAAMLSSTRGRAPRRGRHSDAVGGTAASGSPEDAGEAQPSRSAFVGLGDANNGSTPAALERVILRRRRHRAHGATAGRSAELEGAFLKTVNVVLS